MGVVLLDAGVLGMLVGSAFLLKPPRFLGVTTRRLGLFLLGGGFLTALAGATLPARLCGRIGGTTRLDQFVPVYHFHEAHAIRIRAPRHRVFAAIKAVTPQEIRFFRVLTWLRSPRWPGRGPTRETILAAPGGKPILDVATQSEFLLLAEEPDRELVIGTVLGRRQPPLGQARVEDFLAFDRPGYCKVAMNFYLEEDRPGWSGVRTETRVFATDASARRRFAVYWRVIYPGSALIRRMWLKAIQERAERSGEQDVPKS